MSKITDRNSSISSKTKKTVVYLLAISLIVLISYPYLSDLSADAEWYIMLAEGNVSKVNSPFSSRVLMPYISRLLSSSLGINIGASFLIVNILCLSVFLYTFKNIYESLTSNYYIYTPFVLSPILVYTFESYYLPDLFFFTALLLSVVFLTNNNIYLYILSLLVLFATRGASTILVAVFIVLLCYIKNDMRLLYGTVFASIIGLAGSSLLGARGAGNPHNMNSIAYVLGKLPFNFLKNYGGLSISTNTLGGPKESMLLTVNFPKFLPTGSVRELYIYDFSFDRIVSTMVTLLSIFGVLPTLLLSDLRRYGGNIFTSTPIFFGFSLSYGLVSFLVAPCLGASVFRLVGYGWPAFWIAACLLISFHYTSQNKRWFILISILNLIAMWMVIFPATSMTPKSSILKLTLLISIHLLSYILYSKYLKKDKVNNIESLKESLKGKVTLT
jgi:hypothetical protein